MKDKPSKMSNKEARQHLGKATENRIEIPDKVKQQFRKEKAELLADNNIRASNLSDGHALAIMIDRAENQRKFREDEGIRARLKEKQD